MSEIARVAQPRVGQPLLSASPWQSAQNCWRGAAMRVAPSCSVWQSEQAPGPGLPNAVRGDPPEQPLVPAGHRRRAPAPIAPAGRDRGHLLWQDIQVSYRAPPRTAWRGRRCSSCSSEWCARLSGPANSRPCRPGPGPAGSAWWRRLVTIGTEQGTAARISRPKTQASARLPGIAPMPARSPVFSSVAAPGSWLATWAMVISGAPSASPCETVSVVGAEAQFRAARRDRSTGRRGWRRRPCPKPSVPSASTAMRPPCSVIAAWLGSTARSGR